MIRRTLNLFAPRGGSRASSRPFASSPSASAQQHLSPSMAELQSVESQLATLSAQLRLLKAEEKKAAEIRQLDAMLAKKQQQIKALRGKK